MNQKGITLIYGEEEWIKNEALNKIKSQSVDESDLMNYTTFEGKDLIVSNLIDTGETMPFFAEEKLIVVRKSGLFKAGRKEDTQNLLDWLKKKPNYTKIVFVEDEIDKRNALYKYVKSDFEVIEGVCPDDEALMRILKEACKERELKIEDYLIRYLIMNLPRNIGHILIELDKLASYVGKEAVTKEVINEVCVFSLEQRVFELLKAVSKKNTSQALAIYNKLIESKESPIGVLVLIARQYRILLQVKYLLRTQTPIKQISQSVGVPYYVAQDLSKQAQSFSFKVLQDILELCLESDSAIKTGKMEPVKCIELLIIKCITIQ